MPNKVLFNKRAPVAGGVLSTGQKKSQRPTSGSNHGLDTAPESAAGQNGKSAAAASAIDCGTKRLAVDRAAIDGFISRTTGAGSRGASDGPVTRAGRLDVRNTGGSATISLDGSSGVVTCVSLAQTSDRNVKENFAQRWRNSVARSASRTLARYGNNFPEAGSERRTRSSSLPKVSFEFCPVFLRSKLIVRL